MSHPYVMIGGDAASMSAASKIKREQPDAETMVFERGHYISYSACGMPYWIAGVVESDRKLIILTPERARERRGIDVRTGHEVTAIDPAAKTVTVERLATGESFVQPYEKLLIGTGASAIKPPIPGLDLPGVFTLRAIPDAQQIFQWIQQKQPQRAVIIGGGYIGLEMAEALHDRGLQVAVVEMLPDLLPNFDADMVEEVTAHLVEKGVQVHTGERVNGITAADEGVTVQLASGATLAAELVLVSTGVRPNSELAKAAGLKLGKSGAIWVDAQMRTSDPHIYAAGDCVEHYHLVLGDNATAVHAAARDAGRIGYEVVVREGSAARARESAEEVGRRLAAEGLAAVEAVRRDGRPRAIIEGGEAIVRVPADHGAGGRNQQTVLAAIDAVTSLGPWPAGLAIASVGTDGEDGPTDAAGGLAGAGVVAAIHLLGLDVRGALARCDAHPLLAATGGLIRTGPTGTNVADVRVVLAR